MGTRSNKRKFRRRRQRAGFVLLVSVAIVVLGGVLFFRTDPFQETSSTPVARVEAPALAEAPEAVADQGDNTAQEENEKAAAQKEKASENKAAEEKSEQRAAAKEPAGPPVPATTDMWLTVPALGLYDVYVYNSSDPATLDYGLAKLEETSFPWQDNANTYIAGHRIGWPGTASDHIFYNLPLLGYGDKIYLTDANGTTYTYEVTEFFEVLPSEGWVSDGIVGRNMVSLQTCIENYGDYWTEGPNWFVRYVVRADRVAVDPA